MSKYSIIVPIHNEETFIKPLLNGLMRYESLGHEIIIIDDGSTDSSLTMLKLYNFIRLVKLKVNTGKGYAVRKGLKLASHNKIIIFDGDLEIHPSEIKKLMILDASKNIYCVLGSRFKSLNIIKSNYDWGNFMFTSFFNILFSENHKDVLCFAKSFYLDKYMLSELNALSFDIDVELTSLLSMRQKQFLIPQVILNYKRRHKNEGKKLKVSDGWIILIRILKMIKFY